MGRDDPQLKLRLSEEMKNAVTEAAKQSGRSVNAEIVDRLAKTFEGAFVEPGEMAKIDARFDQLAEFVTDLAEQLRASAAREGELQGKIMALVEALQQSTAQGERLIAQFEKRDDVSS